MTSAKRNGRAGADSLGAMRPTYSPEAEAYREKVQAFLAEHLPADWQGIGQLDHDERRRSSSPSGARPCTRTGCSPSGWPKEYGGGGLSAARAGDRRPRSSPRPACPRAGRTTCSASRCSATRCCSGAPRSRSGTTCPRILSRRGRLVPGLLRAQRRLRPRQRRHAGRARRRPVGDQRPEDLDLGRPPRRPHLRASPAPTPTRRSTRASRFLLVPTCASPASRSARSR